MRNNIKKILIKCVAAFILLSLNTFAAVVSDNDGSAFITKAEFDSLKNNFQSQIDQYNTNIDNKIDAAVASYIAGSKMEKTTVENMPVAANEKILLCNSRYITDLAFGKIGIDWKMFVDMVNNRDRGNNNCGSVTMTRTGTSAYEAFIVNDARTRFLYYGKDLKIDTKVVYTILRPIGGGVASVTSLTSMKLRWGANAYRTIESGTADTIDTQGSVLWHPQFGHNRFFAWYACGLNFGTTYYGGSTEWDRVLIDNNSTVSISGDKVKWIIDASDANTTVWVRDPEQRPASLNRLNQTNYVTTNKDYTYPSSAGISTTCKVYMKDRTGSGTWGDTLKYTGNVTWVNYGTYKNTSTANTNSDWSELHLETNSKNPAAIVNDNFDSEILSHYASYGFNGYITQGIPIGVFKENSKIKFDLNTTSAGVAVNFAINNRAFPTDEICDIGKVDGLSLKVDGVVQDVSVVGLSAGKHTIEIGTERDEPVFCKLSVHKDSTNRNKRLIITWPETYQLTVE